MTRDEAAGIAATLGFEEGWTDAADVIRLPGTTLISLGGRYYIWDAVCQDFECIE